ncbi:UvrD-helicase domain-containing protein [Rhodoferax sp.]|uniref:UvrD-helicase domain-containing protein n=1 Tax=Rhodoferax sp. TaxID=50421 RepID=UPI00374DC4F3
MPAIAAFEHNGVLVSRAHFYAIACDPARSVAVEACAGAGKTWMLVSRMVRALLNGCAPQDILAITFTKKAAGEMRQRLQQWLGDYAVADDAALRLALKERGMAGEPTGEQLHTLRQLHATLLRGGRPVQIRTFHSWFAALLRSAPLSVLNDLGLPTQYELLENDARAVAQVWRRFQTRVAQDDESGGARADYLAAVASYGRHQTHKALEAALAKRVEFVLADAQGVVDASVAHFSAQYPDFAGLEVPQDRLQVPVVVQLLQDSARLLGASSLVTCTKAATALERAVTDGNVAAMFDALLTQKGTARKFSDKLAGLDTVQQTQDLLLRVQQAGHQHSAWLHQQRMARLARGLVEDYAALKRERGWIDMGDLERAALTLMSDEVLSGWVQEKLDARVRHLLIDEFQDTNPLQWQALSAWLSGYGGAGNAPSVFIVGDPKQSIYRFRRAEPQVFQAAKAFVVQGLGGDVLSCDHTRRNAPAILNVVNAVMEQAQTAGEFDGYRAHSTESSAPGQVFKLPRLLREPKAKAAAGDDMQDAVWRDSLTMPRFEAEDTRKTLECRQAAGWLAHMLQGPGATLAPEDIMVLARKRERLGLMQAELAALHIATQQPEKNDLCDMPEVQDIVALLDVLVSNLHDLSLARALKSPLFGASDADLVQLVLCQRALQAHTDGPDAALKPSWWHTLQHASGLPLSLVEVGATLLGWKQLLDILPPHDALSVMYQQGDVLARFAAAAPRTARDGVLANLRALLNAVLALDGGRYTTAYGLVRALRTGGIAAPVRADAGAVRLLTVHGAKGLEAPLVLLLDTDGESPKAETMGVLVNWPGEAAYPERFAFLASESRPPACLVDALTQEQAARRREELNGLYVALTRTQTTLVVSSLEPHIQNPGSWWQRLEPLAQDAVWPQEPDAFAPGDCAANPGALANGQPDAGSFTLKILPNQAAAPVEYAQAATKVIAISKVQVAPKVLQDSLESRLGQAMHRLLEWVDPVPSGVHAVPWLDAQLARVAADFALDAGQVQTAAAWAQVILGGDAAWVWDAGQLAWFGNEVPLTQRGRSLRIDRLVQHAATGDWWVLDYKSTATPQDQPDLVAQLFSYRTAVAQAYPGHTVRAAFLTAQGALIEISDP